MHLVLTEPWEAGTIDDGATYPHAKIVGFSVGIASVKQVTIVVEFGTYTQNAWVRGKVGRYLLRLKNEEFTGFLQSNASTLQALQQALYDVVQSKYPQQTAGVVV